MLKLYQNLEQLSTRQRAQLMVLTGVLLLIIRLCLFCIESNDFKDCLLPWFEQLKANGGISALSKNLSNYNMPYMTIMAIMTYIPVNPLWQIKALSVVFDYGTAIVGYKVILEIVNYKKHTKGLIAYTLLLAAPTIVLNSAAWGQCDSIYTFLVVFSIYYLLKKSFHLSFLFLGCAFAFKLQFMFIVPMFGIYAICRHPKLLFYFPYIPIVNIILCLPGMLVGVSPFYTFDTYFGQMEFWHLACNVANMCTLLPDIEILSSYTQILTITLFFGLLFYVYQNREKWSDKNEKELTMTLGLLSVCLCYYFLPCMHDRYLYMGDVLSIIWWVAYGTRKNIYIPVVVNIVSIVTYMEALLQFVWLLPLYVLSVALFVGLLLLFKHLNTIIHS